jgi:hypothetical protein
MIVNLRWRDMEKIIGVADLICQEDKIVTG